MIAQKSIILAALVNQFMTSEYMHTYDASLDDEFGEKTVSILLDGEESEMIFIDHPASEMSVSSAKCRFKLFVKALMVEIWKINFKLILTKVIRYCQLQLTWLEECQQEFLMK